MTSMFMSWQIAECLLRKITFSLKVFYSYISHADMGAYSTLFMEKRDRLFDRQTDRRTAGQTAFKQTNGQTNSRTD